MRWGDERTFTTVELPEAVAFVGIPHHSIVSIGTYGCCQTQDEKRLMHLGVVYGAMPKNVFCDLPNEPRFLRFDNWDKERHA
ncbi:DUF4417 domain-containing protein [Fibrobacter intestinalis]|uniref:DUF4417 domain-containing protein n=1 Tax=Fibrobacter intestinalis TaxID=28122 RepID=UPI0009337756|nr:DUF4417 domain-containing protein [Fibrobacter intestinalis]